ncbi:alpha-N-acetylglucosaminidase, partial [human gut metagenome]
MKKYRQAWDILLKTCYKDDGYEENEVGSTLAARPQLMPKRTGPCCISKVYYNTKEFEKAVDLFISVADEFEDSRGYQYDLCDMVRQCFSNRFYDNQKQFSKYFKLLQRKKCERIAKTQLELLLDMDSFISCRSEMTLAK